MRTRSALTPTLRPSRNEGKCCDAVIRRIESDLSAQRGELQFPDNEKVVAKVEIECAIGDQRYAFEHILIEPFEGFAKMEGEAEIRVRPISQLIEKEVPAGETWQLTIPFGELQKLCGRDLKRTQDAIVHWAIENAASINVMPYGSYRRPFAWSRPAFIPFDVRLDRWKNPVTNLRFLVRYAINQSALEPMRTQRLLRACSKKLSKLEVWKNRGARTVLVLEDTDLFSTNEVMVFEALEKIKNDFEYWPDEMYLVGTFLDAYWPIWALWKGDLDYWSLEDQGESRTECDVTTLIDLTGR